MRTIAEVLGIHAKKREEERRVSIEKKHRPNFFIRNAKTWLIIFANIIALTFDALAVTTVYSLTGGNAWMSLLSLLPTGVPMILWELGLLNPLANPDQKNRSTLGVIVSIVSAFIVGVLAVLAVEFANWGQGISVLLLVWCVSAVIFHGVQAALYFYRDPIIERERTLQNAISEQEFQMDTLAHSRTVLAAVREGLGNEKALRDEFGDLAVDRWLGIILGDEGEKSVGSPARPVPPPMPTLPPQRQFPRQDLSLTETDDEDPH